MVVVSGQLCSKRRCDVEGRVMRSILTVGYLGLNLRVWSGIGVGSSLNIEVRGSCSSGWPQLGRADRLRGAESQGYPPWEGQRLGAPGGDGGRMGRVGGEPARTLGHGSRRGSGFHVGVSHSVRGSRERMRSGLENDLGSGS